MSLSKLKKIHVIIIGSVLCVIAGVAVFFLQIKPQKIAYTAAEGRYTAAVGKGNEQSKQAALKAKQSALDDLHITQAQMDMQMKRRMPNLNFSRRDIGMLALWKEQIKTLGPLLESFAHDKSVVVRGANFQIQPPPANPNDAIFEQDVLVFPLGSVTVSGDFKHLMDNVRRWNNCQRLVMVGPSSLTGVSPELTETYSLTCYIFPAVKADASSKIQMAGGGAASGAPGAPGAAPAPVP